MNEISMALKGINVFCDLVCVVGEGVKQIDRPAPHNDDQEFLDQLSLGNRVVNVTFSIADVAFTIAGADNATMEQLKQLETYSRTSNVFVQIAKQYNQMEPGFQGKLVFIERGIVAPTVDVARSIFESDAYREKGLLGRLSKEKNPIQYEECKKRLDDSVTGVRNSTFIRAGAEFSVVSSAAKTIYQRLADRFIPLRHAAGANQANAANNVFSLVALNRIPDEFANDVILSRYICPISQAPIRFPVGDPDGTHVYEREEIIAWIRLRHTSPMTRRALNEQDLVPKPALQALINHRLRFHEQHLMAYVAQSPLYQLNETLPADPNLQGNANQENPNL